MFTLIELRKFKGKPVSCLVSYNNTTQEWSFNQLLIQMQYCENAQSVNTGTSAVYVRTKPNKPKFRTVNIALPSYHTIYPVPETKRLFFNTIVAEVQTYFTIPQYSAKYKDNLISIQGYEE
jgi:hypothetical protein